MLLFYLLKFYTIFAPLIVPFIIKVYDKKLKTDI
jgi:hypothetical protein